MHILQILLYFYPIRLLNQDKIELIKMRINIEAQGIYCLFTDKGTPVIGRRVNGDPIFQIGGGCTKGVYCDGASPALKQKIDEIAEGPFTLQMDTKPKREIYREMLQNGEARLGSRRGGVHALQSDEA